MTNRATGQWMPGVAPATSETEPDGLTELIFTDCGTASQSA